MIQLIRSLAEFVASKTNSWGFKIAFILTLFGVILSFDYLMKISFHHHQNNTLSQIEKIVSIKPYYESDSVSLEKIKEIEYNALNNGHYSEKIDEFLSIENNFIEDVKKTRIDTVSNDGKIDIIDSIVDTGNLSSVKVDTIIIANNENTKIIDSLRQELMNRDRISSSIKEGRNLFWMVISSNYSVVMIALMLLFVPFVDKTKIDANFIFGWFASYVILGIWTTIITWMAYKIPQLSYSPAWNYVLNAVIHSLFLVLLISVIRKNQPTKA